MCSVCANSRASPSVAIRLCHEWFHTMYFPIGWPKLVDTAIIGAGAGPATTTTIRQICCDRVKILLAVLSDDFLGIWYTKVQSNLWLLNSIDWYWPIFLSTFMGASRRAVPCLASHHVHRFSLSFRLHISVELTSRWRKKGAINFLHGNQTREW